MPCWLCWWYLFRMLCVSTLNAVLCLECNILDCYLDSNLDCHPDHCLFLTISGRARGQIRIWSDRHIDRSRPTALSASLCTQQALMTMVMMVMMMMMAMMMMMMMMEGF